MIELIVSLIVGVIVLLTARRCGNVFSLPFFWAAFFVCQYLGLLQIHARHGGYSFVYAAAAFGCFYVGLLAADFRIPLRSAQRAKTRKDRSDQDAAEKPFEPYRGQSPTKINLLFPALPLSVGLFVSLVAATFVTLVFFSERGIPILSSFPALAWVQATSGIVNRLMTVFGPGCFASLGLVGWAVHRESGSQGAKAMMYLGLGLAILAEALLATKAAAILVFIWFNLLLFYFDKKRDLRKSLLPLIVVVIPISAAIVAVRLMSIQGHWEPQELYQIYYDRVTTEAAQPADYVLKYTYRFGPLHGEAMRRELDRIEDQLKGRPKTPLLSEFVYNLLNHLGLNNTGLSAGLMLYGTGYAEWGLLGLVLYSLLQGLVFGWVHKYLLRQVSMNLVMLIVWGAVLTYLITVSGTGTILITLESLFLAAIPPMIMLFPFCLFFLLPVARRYKHSVGSLDPRITHGEV